MGITACVELGAIGANPPAIPFPGVRRALRGRGVTLDGNPEEGAEERSDRVATELMALFRDTRDEEAYESLYRHSRESVLHWIRRRISESRAPLDPQELLQDTFVNVYRYSSSFRSDHRGSFRVWVRTISANAVRRSLGRRPGFSLQCFPEGLQEPADPSASPREAAIQTEGEEEVQRAWTLLLFQYAQAYRSLSERDQEAMHLVEVDELSYAECGQRLRVGPSNMKMIMFRARRRLMKHLRGLLSKD